MTEKENAAIDYDGAGKKQETEDSNDKGEKSSGQPPTGSPTGIEDALASHMAISAKWA